MDIEVFIGKQQVSIRNRASKSRRPGRYGAIKENRHCGRRGSSLDMTASCDLGMSRKVTNGGTASDVPLKVQWTSSTFFDLSTPGSSQFVTEHSCRFLRKTEADLVGYGAVLTR